MGSRPRRCGGDSGAVRRGGASVRALDVPVNNAADYEADTFLPGSPAESENRDERGSAREACREGEGQGGGGGPWVDGPISFSISARTHDRHFAVNTRASVLLMSEFARRLVVANRHWGRIINLSADWSWGSPSEVSYRASNGALEIVHPRRRRGAGAVGCHGECRFAGARADRIYRSGDRKDVGG
jgi:NAD(P)-dependent dehydrogenase (short-subunit alcohol dehydrogenase family)